MGYLLLIALIAGLFINPLITILAAILFVLLVR